MILFFDFMSPVRVLFSPNVFMMRERVLLNRESEREKSVYYYAKCHHRLVFNSFGGRKEDTSDMKNDSSSSTAFFISYDDIKYLSQLILIALIA